MTMINLTQELFSYTDGYLQGFLQSHSFRDNASTCSDRGKIAAGLRQHSHSWYRATSGSKVVFLFITRQLFVLKWGLLFI
jgi:hypothetical protein